MSYGRPWYANPSILLIILTSLVAVGMAGLSLLLLPSPDEIVLAAQRRALREPRMAVHAEALWQGSGPGGEQRTRYAADWQVDRTDAAAPLAWEQFDLRTGVSPERQFMGEHLHDGRTDAVRFRVMPSGIGPLRFDAFRDRWLSVDLTALASPLGVPLVGGGRRISDEDAARLRDVAGRTPFFRVRETLPKEDVRGAETRHYKVEVEPLYLKDLYRQFEEARLGRIFTAKERLASDVFFASLSFEDGEAWVGAKDGRMYRLRVRARFDGARTDGTLDLSLDFSAFGEQATPPAPAQAQDVTGILASLLPSVAGRLPLAADGGQNVGTAPGGGLPVSGAGAGVEDADGDGLPDVMEQFYGSDPRTPDSDGDGVNDGAEVERGDSPTGPGKLFDFTGGRF